MGTRVSLQTSLQINSLCFNSGNVFNLIFLVENKDNILQRWSPPWTGNLQTTYYCVQMVIVLSSIDELLIQAHEYSRTPHFSILNPQLSILDSRFLHLETWTSLPSRSEDWVSRIASRLSTYCTLQILVFRSRIPSAIRIFHTHQINTSSSLILVYRTKKQPETFTVVLFFIVNHVNKAC